MNKLKNISGTGAVVAMFVCLLGETVFSGAMKNVYSLAGNSAFLCFLIASVAIVFLSFVFINMSPGFISSAVCAVYLLTILSRLASSMALFQSKAVIVAVLAAVLLLSLLAFAVKIKGATIFGALCFIPIILVFALCLLLGLGEYSFKNVATVFDRGFGGVFLGTLNAFSVLFPLLLPLIFISSNKKRLCVITLSACCGSITLAAFLGTIAFGVTASQYQSVTAEISKNVSVGKFFQRLEGPADVIYILSAISAVVLLSAMIGSGVGQDCKLSRSMVLFGAVAAVISAAAFLSVNFRLIYDSVQAVSVLFGVCLLLFVPDVFKFKHLAPAIVALCLTLCSCSGASEIENSKFVVIAAYDSGRQEVSFVTESGNGSEFYSVKASDFNSARSAVESSHSVVLSFKQMGALLLDKNCDEIYERLKWIIESEMPNSSLLCLFEGDMETVYTELIKGESSAFDFVSKLKSGTNHTDAVFPTVSKVNAELASHGASVVGLIGREGYKGRMKINQKGRMESVIY